jgi:membrane protein
VNAVDRAVLAIKTKSPRAKRVLEGIEVAGETWGKHRSGGLAAEMAFFAMLSIFPTLLAVAAALGSLEAFVGSELADRVQRQVLAYLQDILTERAAGGIDAVRLMFEQQNDSLFTIAVAGAVWTLARSMHAATTAIGTIYEVPETRPWWLTRLLSIGFAAGTIVALAATLALFVLGPLFGLGVALADVVGLGNEFVRAWDYLRGPMAFLVLMFFALIVFRFAPARRFGFKHDLPGALVTTGLWLVTSFGLRAYIQVASAGNGVYAALGGALIVLIWFYLLALSLVIGAEVNSALTKRKLRKHVDQLELFAVASTSAATPDNQVER